MLRVRTIYARSAAASARYYTRYLAGEGEERGRWRGSQAAGLGLTGAVDGDDLEAVLSGHDPTTGTRLGSALVDRYKTDGTVIKAVAGYDATFSAPKSLSVWWGLTGDPGLIDAHNVAVEAVLDHLERRGATTRVRVNGTRSFPDAQGLTMATFRQSTSREDDPQLHTHAVISAKVRGPDGGWFALDARFLKRKQRALGGLYQSVLRAELTHRYGVAWGPIVDGQAEIAGMPAELLEAFSKRSEQVEELLELKLLAFRESEGRDPSRWERAAIAREAAADSRADKSGNGVADLGTRWHDEAAALGWTPERLQRQLQRTRTERPGPTEPPSPAQVIDALSAQGSTWLPIDVLETICDLAHPDPRFSGREWARVLEQAADEVAAAHRDLDPPPPGPLRAADGRSIWVEPIKANLTHDTILAQEERILAFALDAHSHEPAPSRTVDTAGLDVLQADAARAVAGDDRLVLVVGPAGTGKTTALARAVADLQATGRAVLGIAPTAKAAHVLATETHMPATTMAKLLHEWSRPTGPDPALALPAGTTVVCDEAGMAGTPSLDRLVSLAESQRWRLVLVGDPRQLQAVGRGGMFDELCRTARRHELAAVHRFHHTWEQTATLQLRRGDPTVIDTYLQHGRVSAGGLHQQLDAIADARTRHTIEGRRVAVTAETNDHVDALNTAIQDRCRQAGLADPKRVVPVAGTETAGAGDLVVTRRNDRGLRTDHGDPVRNRDLWRTDAVHPDGALTVSRVDGPGTVRLPADYVRSHVRLGYAATAHGHQGDTTDISYTLVSAATTHPGLYVGATRGRHENHLCVITDEPDLAEARDVVERTLVSERADVPAVARRRELAHHVPRPQQPAVDDQLTARQALAEAEATAAPHEAAIDHAQARLDAAQAHLAQTQRRADRYGPASRLRHRDQLRAARHEVDRASAALHTITEAAQPALTAVEQAREELSRADADASLQRLRAKLDRLGREPIGREPPGLSLGR